MTTTTITPFLWFDNTVPQAVEFYSSVFPDAKIEVSSDFLAIFELQGQRFYALNGGPQFKFTEAVSFFISVDTQEEVDHYWNKLTAEGGEESMCGWLKDKFGLSWQVIPRKLMQYQGSSDRAAANRVNEAMLKMRKIIIAELDKAYAGA
ncbi:MAG TPA: VOC family protein [Devosia sp.]|jgi:predicted 3-demethylubiquinone-9 3-methyltransferase (glyoxalase superfamily)|nr:VOC family protein [Devosia sp.]